MSTRRLPTEAPMAQGSAGFLSAVPSTRMATFFEYQKAAKHLSHGRFAAFAML